MEDKQLLDKISEISGKINRHKNTTNTQQQTGPQPWNKYVSSTAAPSWRSPRSGPYVRPSPKPVSKVPAGHRNRTLVVNAKGSQTTASDDDQAGQGQQGWVSKRDRHMQLINTSIYDKETQARTKAMAETRRQRAQRRDQREQQKIQTFLQSRPSVTAVSANTQAHEIVLDGLRFRILSGGSKLARVRDEHDMGTPSPKTATVGGVTFNRSKNGNLYRRGIVRAKRAVQNTKKINEPCKRFTTTGQCYKGPQCRYVHDPTKVAMCRIFLQTGSCPKGALCDLSHEPDPCRVPACVHFQRGKCSASPCRYAHVHVSPTAPVCRAFGILGYCEAGAECPDRHVHECPDYANTGACPRARCQLPHVDRAGQIRKQQQQQEQKKSLTGRKGRRNTTGRTESEEEDDDDNDEEEEGDEHASDESDDMDSDGWEEMMLAGDGRRSDSGRSQGLSQQHDFVGFGS